MSDETTPGGWPDAARPGVPQSPERDGPCVLRAPDGAEHDVFWNAREQQYEWPHDGWLTPANATEFGWRLVKQDRLYTEAEVAAQVEAVRREEREACAVAARCVPIPEDACAAEAHGRISAALEACMRIRARGDAIPGEYRSEAEQERDELFNRLGRVTEELGISMDVTASRIIEVIRERVDDEREACASVSVRVEVPAGAETWSPLEAWEEALTVLDGAFRDAIRARGDA
jgi:hypothetical protein